MLEPREADVPVLFLVLVVLPLVTYILLGKCNDAAKKKARISMLAQLASEEALRVESMVFADVIATLPHPNPAFYECARCSAPATTRCSKCKSVRYCSGKCQIIHWRQGHKQECQEWQGNSSSSHSNNLASAKDAVQLRSLFDSSNPFLENDIDDPLYSDFPADLPNDPDVMSVITPSEREISHSDQHLLDKFRRETSKSGDGIAHALDGSGKCSIDPEFLPRDAPQEHKFQTGNLGPNNRIHRNQDKSRQTNSHTPTVQCNIMYQPHKLAVEREIKDVLRPSSSSGIPDSSPLGNNVIDKCGNGSELPSERPGFQAYELLYGNETLGSCSFTENTLVRGGIMYKKPPYVLPPTTTSSQKSTEEASRKSQSQVLEWSGNVKNESRVSRVNVLSNIPSHGYKGTSNIERMKMEGSKNSSKATKQNLLGLIKDYKKNKVLFPYEDLAKIFQFEVRGISPRGLLNCGNSCYANAVLQCLSSTKPLIVYLLQRSHSRSCWVRGWCLMCELEQHVSMLREGGGPLSPNRILSNINIGCRMGGGNQEDAHEFLRLLVMSMQSICLEGVGGEKEVDPWLQETTLIQQIFGGRLKSKVKCLRCHLESERYENIMDLTLEIHGWVESLEDALTQFTAPEDLDGENMYRCGRCCKYVKARKQLSVHEVPNILTVVLKRFQTGEYGKINKCVTFPDMLDMIPFVSGTADTPPLYMLYAAIVHLDTLNASFSGHYVSYVKDLQGTWFRIDDAEVQVVPSSQVMSEGAYMLFYSRSFPRPPRVYNEKAPSRAGPPPIHTTYKTPKHEQGSENSPTLASKDSTNVGPENREPFRYDPVSSDWSLFTSSDDSSFTTESTRDSFSSLDSTISSIFSPLFGAEYPHSSSSVTCSKSSPCRPQTMILSDSKGFGFDVHRGRQTNSSLFGRCGTNSEDDFVRNSGYCDM